MDKYLSMHSVFDGTRLMCFRNSSAVFDTIHIICRSHSRHCCCCLNDQKETIRTQKILVQHFVWSHFKRFRQVPCCSVVRAMFHKLYSFIHSNHFQFEMFALNADDPQCSELTDKQKHSLCTYARFSICIKHVINSLDRLGVGSGSSGVLRIKTLWLSYDSTSRVKVKENQLKESQCVRQTLTDYKTTWEIIEKFTITFGLDAYRIDENFRSSSNQWDFNRKVYQNRFRIEYIFNNLTKGQQTNWSKITDTDNIKCNICKVNTDFL